MSYVLLHLDPTTGETHRTSVEPGSRSRPRDLSLRGLPGGHAVQLVLEDEAGGAAALRVELELEGQERATVRLWEEGSALRFETRRPAVQLPTDPRHAAPPPLLHLAEAERIDLVFLVDLTTRTAREVEGRTDPELWLLLGNTPEWQAHIADLAAFAEGLAAGGGVDLRTGVLGFGDTLPTGASAADLTPAAPPVVPPEAHRRELLPFDKAELQRRLRELPPTTGADFVDALAQGLAAARELPWRDDARRLLLLVGDSPGYSITRPAPRGADVQIRSHDVDTEAARLARERSVELLTLYHALPPGLPLRELPHVPPFLAHAEAQYRRLAAHPDWAWTVGGFDPDLAAEAVRAAPALLARGLSLPVLPDEGR